MNSKAFKITIVILIVLLLTGIFSYGGIIYFNQRNNKNNSIIEVPGNKITDETEEEFEEQSKEKKEQIEEQNEEQIEVFNEDEQVVDESLLIKLFKHHKEDNAKFNMSNMFPGDSETKRYCVRVSYKDKINLRFKTILKDEYKELANVLNIKIKMLNSDEVLYEGLFLDLPEEIIYKISSNDYVTEDFYYEVTVSLDTSVGNDYQNKKLECDFKWWVEEDNLEISPDTGDYVIYWIGGAFISVALLSFVIKRRKDYE